LKKLRPKKLIGRSKVIGRCQDSFFFRDYPRIARSHRSNISLATQVPSEDILRIECFPNNTPDIGALLTTYQQPLEYDLPAHTSLLFWFIWVSDLPLFQITLLFWWTK